MPTYSKQDPSTIQSMFNDIAQRYDKANSILSFCLHKKWNKKLINEVVLKNQSHTLLDLCCGTGDIAFGYLNQVQKPCQAHLVDFCSNMLVCAKEKMEKKHSSKHAISYIEADVQFLPFDTNTADCATLAYGIRNVQDTKQCVKESYRVLKPGGCFGILELTQPQSLFLRWGHRFYLKTLLPILGKWMTDNEEAYQYLQSSIQTFISPIELEQIMKNSGFVNTKRIILAAGIATIFIGYKPR